MNVKTIIKNFTREGSFDREDIAQFQENRELRRELVDHFRQNRNHLFAVVLLDTLVEMRRNFKEHISSEDLMLACYLLGLHKNVGDCMKVWAAKDTDFDTYCGLDIQLMVFAGVNETISFLKLQDTPEGIRALEYVTGCLDSGDFDDIDEYLNSNTLLWWI